MFRFGFEMILWVTVVGFLLFAVANLLVRPVRLKHCNATLALRKPAL